MDSQSQTALTIVTSAAEVSAGQAIADLLPAKPMFHYLVRSTTHRMIRWRSQEEKLKKKDQW